MLSSIPIHGTTAIPPRPNMFVDPNWVFPVRATPKPSASTFNGTVKNNRGKTRSALLNKGTKDRDKETPIKTEEIKVKTEEMKVKKEVIELDDDMDDGVVIVSYTSKSNTQHVTKGNDKEKGRGHQGRPVKTEIDETGAKTVNIGGSNSHDDNDKQILGKRKRNDRGRGRRRARGVKLEDTHDDMGDDDDSGDDKGTINNQDDEEEWKSITHRPLRKRVKVSYIDQGDNSSNSESSDTYDESDDGDDDDVPTGEDNGGDDEGRLESEDVSESDSTGRDDGKGEANAETGRVQTVSSRKDGVVKPLCDYAESTQKVIKRGFGGDVKKYLEYRAQRDRDRRMKNKGKISEQQRAFYQRNKDKISEQKKAYRQRNKDKILEQKKAYRQRNKDKISERKKSYYQRNKDKVLERRRVLHSQEYIGYDNT